MFHLETQPGTKLSSCCHNGKVSLQPFGPYPDNLKRLVTARHDTMAMASNFKKNVRQYNSACAFASMGAQLQSPPGHGPFCYRIHGQIYHRVGSLHPASESEAHKYAQLYIIDSSQALDARMGMPENEQCRLDVMHTVQSTIDSLSPYAAAYKHMAEVEREEEERATAAGVSPRKVKMLFHRGSDPRRYNMPSHDEVAVVFVTAPDGAPPSNRDLAAHPRETGGDMIPSDFVVQSHGTSLQRIPDLSQHCDPMVCDKLILFSAFNCNVGHLSLRILSFL